MLDDAAWRASARRSSVSSTAFRRATERDGSWSRRARGRHRRRGRAPPAVDLREPWWKVGEQGSTGSCVGWAVGDGLLRWHFVKAGKLAQTDTHLASFHVDGLEGDGRVDDPSDDVHRPRPARRSSRPSTSAASTARSSEFMLPFASAKLYARPTRDLLCRGRAAEDLELFQPGR